MGEPYPEEILAELNADQRRMIIAGKVDRGGEGARSWEHVFGSDSRIWQRTTTRPEPHLTKLGIRIYYAIISEQAGKSESKSDG